jgi:uncharacterized membrane protein YdjX (TVP38/TMEM64 family)
MKRLALISLSLLVIFSLSFVMAEESGLISQENTFNIIDLIMSMKHGHTYLSIFVFLLFSLDIVLPVPSSLVMLAAASVLGPTSAFLICFIGLCASATLAYEVCRKGLLTRLFLGQHSDEQSQKWVIRLKRHGFWIIMITRPIPMMTELFSCLAGVAKVPRWRYYSASALANAVFALTYTILPTALGLDHDHWPFTIGFGLPGVLMGVWWLGSKLLAGKSHSR